jgi:hypothetical protein
MLFNTFPITITGVAGLNDIPGLSTVNGTCATCHDHPTWAITRFRWRSTSGSQIIPRFQPST